ncbi:MAG: ATP-binding protein [Gammaproteobacteria bacterium]|nr:ATP-binding protein [Gammaproteobacteria bacterium]MDE0443798.1 ATP-binding protein [Gammaproteobacteria bacterium]
MIPRMLRGTVLDALKRQAAVAIVGPRQSGKTTLARQIGNERGAIYLDLEDRDDRSRLDEPVLFLDGVADRLVILDEIHRAPELFQTLRGVIDRGREQGKGVGRFLILGSASIDLLRQSGESLAGRITYLDLGPFSVGEVDATLATRERLWLRGGFPMCYLASDDEASLSWRKDFIRTYLERDVPAFGPRVPAATLERLWTMLAHRQGTLLNASALAHALEVSPQSVTRYVDLLVDLLLVRRLPPMHANVGKRLVKSPKVYIRDSGIVHALLGIPSLTALAGHPVVGRSWEGFAIETLVSALPWPAFASFYRTQAGAEIDLVIEYPNRELWAIEIKRSLSAKPGRGFHVACEDIRPARRFVVHAGDDRYPVSATIEGIGLSELAREIRGSP